MSIKILAPLRGMSLSASIFVLVLIANLAFVAYLAFGNYQNGALFSQSQKNGEQMIAWFEAFSNKVQAGETPKPSTCLPLSEEESLNKSAKFNHWKGCVEDLFSKEGPFHSYSNLLKPDSSAYAAKCNKQELGTSGAFIFQKMTSNLAGLPAVTPLEPGEKLIGGLEIRLSLCDTGYYLVKIGEFKL